MNRAGSPSSSAALRATPSSGSRSPADGDSRQRPSPSSPRTNEETLAASCATAATTWKAGTSSGSVRAVYSRVRNVRASSSTAAASSGRC